VSEHGHHIIPYKVYYIVFGSLIFLTITTVITASFDLGVLHVPVALAFAVAKATLVVMFFMALKYDTRVNMMVFGVGLLFVFIFIGFTLLDTEFRGTFDPMFETTVAEEQVIIDEQEARIEEINQMEATAAADSTAGEEGAN
jgi:cytochrome c oxidase subunit 4